MTHPQLMNAMVLLGEFQKGKWSELHVRSQGLEMYLRRSTQGRNPMVSGAPDPGAETSTGSADIVAPHLGTFRRHLAAGDSVRAGDKIASLEVLDEIIALESKLDGVIEAIFYEDGVLIEHGQILARIVAGK